MPEVKLADRAGHWSDYDHVFFTHMQIFIPGVYLRHNRGVLR